MKNKLYENHLKEVMAKRPVFGMTIYSGCPQFVELLGYAGFDFEIGRASCRERV